MNNAFFGTKDIKLVTTEVRWNYLISEPTYDTMKFFTENLLSIVMKRTWKLINKSIYSDL